MLLLGGLAKWPSPVSRPVRWRVSHSAKSAHAALSAALLVLVACSPRGADGQGRDGASSPASQAVAPAASVPVPRLVDLGAGKCVPCKAMAPILDRLRADYTGRLEVRFIDVWKTPGEAQAYGIRMIPTQVFYSAEGRELARHEGFISREEILATWKSLGVEL